MNRQILLVVLSIIGCTRAVPLSDQTGSDRSPGYNRVKRQALVDMDSIIESIFLRADNDHDDLLNHPEFWSTYRNFDTNGDGVVLKSEYEQVLTGGAFPMPPSLGPHLIRRFAHLMFRNGDMDGDGTLSSHDARVIFHNLDKDGNDLISHDEYIARWHEVFARIGLIPSD